MPRGRILALLLGGLLFAGVAGWWTWTQAVHARHTSQQLQQTRATLSTTQEQVALLEDERKKLADSYGLLKDRWTTTDEDLQRLKRSSEEMTADVERLSRERADLQRQLEDGAQAAERRTQALTRQAAADRAALETQLHETVRASEELDAAMEQLQERLRSQAGERERLGEQLVELSRAYEGLAQSAAPVTAAGPSAGTPARPDPSASWRAAIEPIDPATLPRSGWTLFRDWLLYPMRPARPLDPSTRATASGRGLAQDSAPQMKKRGSP